MRKEQHGNMELICADCMDVIKSLPDKSYDLAIVDPPYGIDIGRMGFTEGNIYSCGNAVARKKDYRGTDWDKQRPTAEYFNQITRVSKEQIIWGGNYFADLLGPTRAVIVWDKKTDDRYNNSFSDCEIAWCTTGVSRVFRYLWNGMLQGNMKHKEIRFHPTQKPVALYHWLLNQYAKPGQRIIDTHGGSMPLAIAAHDYGCEATIIEINPDYFDKAKKQLHAHQQQVRLF